MDREMLMDHLAQAGRHVMEGEALLAKQDEIIERLRAHGIDVTQARFVLAQLETVQRAHLADRDRLRAELGRSSGSACARESHAVGANVGTLIR